MQAYVSAVVLLQTLRFGGAHWGFKQLTKVWGLHTLQLILAELQPHILKPLFHDISISGAFYNSSSPSKAREGMLPFPTSPLPRISHSLSAFFFWHLSILSAVPVFVTYTRVLLNSFQECSEAQCFIKKFLVLNYLRTLIYIKGTFLSNILSCPCIEPYGSLNCFTWKCNQK